GPQARRAGSPDRVMPRMADPRGQDGGQPVTIGQTRLVAELGGAGGTTGIRDVERVRELRALQAGRDEPGAERIAGADRIDQRGEWHGWPDVRRGGAGA